MRVSGLFTAAVATLLQVADAATLTPGVLPLVVRNPYLSTWLAHARDPPWKKWPIFYTGNEVGLSIVASVSSSNDSYTVYPLLGRAQDSLDSHGKHYNVTFPTYIGANYDASTTNLTYSVPSPKGSRHDPVELVVSFLSPITPTSTLRQSVPGAYIAIYAEGNFDVNVYIDANGQWVSGNRGSDIVWDFEETSKKEKAHLKTWQVRRKTEQLFTEIGDQAEWGTLHLTAPAGANHECGTSAKLRHHFAKTGTLRNKIDSRHRSIMDDEPVFAFSKTLKLSSANTSASILFTLNHLQDPVTQFASARGLTYMRPLWLSYFPTASALLAYHYNDFSSASALATNYSSQLALDAYASGSDSYVDIVSLAARQVMGGTSFSGTPENPILFLKEISSNGNSQTVDVIFPAWPFFLYTNPRWLGYLLEPLLEHMLSGQYPKKYTMHDLGAHFPNLTGHPLGRDEYMPVEECGDMLIMGLSLVQSLFSSSSSSHHGSRPSIWSALGASKDPEAITLGSAHASPFALPLSFETRDRISDQDDAFTQPSTALSKKQAQAWLSKTYRLWTQWTSYLVDFALEPENQLSTDDFAGPLRLHTNLALKGIVGIRAMAGLADVMGEEEDMRYYKNVSEVYVIKWQEFGMSRDGSRAKLAYDWYGSWTTLYSLFADAVLGFHPSLTAPKPRTIKATYPIADADTHQNPIGPESEAQHRPSSSPNYPADFIPTAIYAAQSAWYPTAAQRYGLPLDSRHLYSKLDWAFQAAAVASPDTRKAILDSVARWVNESAIVERPLTDLYFTEEDGGWPRGGPRFFNRPVVGSVFAFLALEGAGGH